MTISMVICFLGINDIPQKIKNGKMESDIITVQAHNYIISTTKSLSYTPETTK